MSTIPHFRPSSSNDEWATPRWLLECLRSEGFAFVLDAAATVDNAVAPYCFTKADDALSRDWTDGPWMNGVVR